MQLPIIYGKEKITKYDHECEILKPADIKLETEEKYLKRIFKSFNKVSFEEFASSSDRLLIIVNDGTSLRQQQNITI